MNAFSRDYKPQIDPRSMRERFKPTPSAQSQIVLRGSHPYKRTGDVPSSKKTG